LDLVWGKKEIRYDAFSTKKKTFVMEWWTMETTIFLDRKKFYKKRIGVKQTMEHPTHFLQVS
jgi:hypothetical protein